MNEKSKLTLVTIGFAKQALVPGSREHARMQNYAEALHEYHIIVFTTRGSGSSEVVREKNLCVYPTNSLTKFHMLFDAFRIGKEIINTRTEPVVISAQDPFLVGLCVYVLGKVMGVRTHLQVHGDYFDSLWAGASVVRFLQQRLALFLMRRVPHIRVVSKRIAASLVRRGIAKEKITVLPIRPELEAFLSLTHEVGDHTPFTFLATSRFAPEKNYPLMLRAFARVCRQHLGIRLRIVGKGDEESRIRAMIAALGISECVEILPWTEAIAQEMARADVFLSTSDHEAYGLTIVEVMAVGLPVITTSVGCVGEVFLDGVHGMVVPTRDEDALVRAMERMMSDTVFRKECSSQGKKTARALASLSQDTYIETWVSAFVK